MNKPQTYDFTEAVAFLNYDVPLESLYTEVTDAMSLLSHASRHIGRKEINVVWSALLTCADFLDTIQLDD